MKHFGTTLTAAVAFSLGAIEAAQAHTAFVVNASSNAFAGKSYFATLNAGHGCEDAAGALYDTEKVTVEIPAGVTKVRPMDADWGPAKVEEKDANGNVTKISWTRTAPAHTEDSYLYRASFTATLPNAPMTTLAFRAVQSCNGGQVETAWEGAEAPTLKLLPARTPGWNKFTAQANIDEATIKAFFADANIVWSGGAAYSANPVTAGLITTPLTSIPTGAEFWVKY